MRHDGEICNALATRGKPYCTRHLEATNTPNRNTPNPRLKNSVPFVDDIREICAEASAEFSLRIDQTTSVFDFAFLTPAVGLNDRG